MYIEQQILHNAVERGNQYVGAPRMWTGRKIFRDLLLDERGAGLGEVMFGFRNAFHIFGKLGEKQVGPTGGR
jgi:hypothetical protein